MLENMNTFLALIALFDYLLASSGSKCRQVAAQPRRLTQRG